tara:strand:- start:3253 stop:3609 length:357 start_codon:yes stop_codon:yes gene_type:complete
MTRSALRRTAAGLVAASVLAFAPAPASAGVELGFLKHWFGPPPLSNPDMRAMTPSCAARPTAAWEGRVSGNSESTYYEHEMAVSLVGCFPTLEECTLWRMRMTGSMQGRIIYNECRPR